MSMLVRQSRETCSPICVVRRMFPQALMMRGEMRRSVRVVVRQYSLNTASAGRFGSNGNRGISSAQTASPRVLKA